MATIIGNELDRSEEASMKQVYMIERLLESRRMSSPVASKIIALLMEEPPLNDTGMAMLAKIQKPE